MVKGIMSFITVDNLNVINVELTNYCNAACPMCPRFDWDLNLVEGVTNTKHTTLKLIEEKIGKKIISKLKVFYSNGIVGDAIMNPECVQIFEFIKRNNNNNCGLVISTNGGARNTDFWKELAKIPVRVTFNIDGLQDTNHLYRRNVKWDRLIANVEAFVSAGGKADWRYLIFKHNEHQIDEAKTLSKKLGFRSFASAYSERWIDFNSAGEFRDVNKIKVDDYYLEKPVQQPEKVGRYGSYKGSDYIDNKQWSEDIMEENITAKEDFMSKKIVCQSCSNGRYEILLHGNGDISPCCMLGSPRIHEAKKLIKDYHKINLNDSTLEEILNGEFFRELEKGIAGDNSRLQTCYSSCKVNA